MHSVSIPTPRYDTLDGIERASRCRLEEGSALRGVRRDFWAVYTLGYVVELCLKAAFLRLAGLEPHENADLFVKGKLPSQWARIMGVARSTQNMHDLLFWLELVMAERSFSRKPRDGEFLREFAIRVQQVAVMWQPRMRYQPSIVMGERVRVAEIAARWILDHHEQLWS